MPPFPPFSLAPCPELTDCLEQLGHFIYLPNPGHAGDSLTAAATQLLFEQMGLRYELYADANVGGEGFTLVFGGGGGLVPDWGYLPWLRQVFSHPKLERCIILPQSMRDCDGLPDAMDERFTVFLRDRESFTHAVSRNRKAQFHLAADMAFCLDAPRFLNLLQAGPPYPSHLQYRLARWKQHFLKRADAHGMLTTELYRTHHKIRSRIGTGLPRCLQQLPDGRKVAWMLRRDRESASSLSPQAAANFDLALIHDSLRMRPAENVLVAGHFLQAINAADIIITDRRAVAIGAVLLGKQLILRDNSRNSLSALWEQHLQTLPHVHLCRSDAEVEAQLHQIIDGSDAARPSLNILP